MPPGWWRSLCWLLWEFSHAKVTDLGNMHIHWTLFWRKAVLKLQGELPEHVWEFGVSWKKAGVQVFIGLENKSGWNLAVPLYAGWTSSGFRHQRPFWCVAPKHYMKVLCLQKYLPQACLWCERPGDPLGTGREIWLCQKFLRVVRRNKQKTKRHVIQSDWSFVTRFPERMKSFHCAVLSCVKPWCSLTQLQRAHLEVRAPALSLLAAARSCLWYWWI